MLNIKKGTKVFFLQVNGEEVKKAEWTKVTRYYVDSTTWTCDTVLDLENGHSMFDENGASAHKRNQHRLSDNVLMNQIVWGVFTFIGTTKGETIKLANQFLTGEASEIQHDIRVLEDRISKILEVKKKLKIIKMEVISKEEYLKVHYGDRKDYFRLVESKLKPMKFSIGDVIHTIDYHYLEDDEGNDIDQEIMFVNPKVITGKYEITGFVDGEPNDYYCITILDKFGRSGSTAYVSEKVIFENYKNSNMI